MLFALRALFLSFKVVTNLKINLAKSKLVYVGNVNKVDGWDGIMGCLVFFFFFEFLKYLGFSLGDYHKTKSIWDGIIEKIKHELTS
jgi:phosphate starvation-inducible membrane PsiE